MNFTKLAQYSGFSAEWASKSLETFNWEREPEAYRVAQKYVHKWQNCREAGIGLLFRSGIHGVGKTHLIWGVMCEVIRMYPTPIRSEYTDEVERWENISAQRWDVISYLNTLHMFFENRNHRVGKASSCDLLVLDDLGREMNSSFSNTQLRALINTRYEVALPTLYTTTANDLVLTQKLGSDTWDRIRERSKIVEFQSTESYRIEQGKQKIKEIGL